MLATLDDPEEFALPEVRRDRFHEQPETPEVEQRRFRVWKTKFWKRRGSYRQMKGRLDDRWNDITSRPEEAW